MADRLYQNAILQADDVEPHLLANTLASAIHSLAANAEDRHAPLALDWSEVRIKTGPVGTPGLLRVEVSAPVL